MAITVYVIHSPTLCGERQKNIEHITSIAESVDASVHVITAQEPNDVSTASVEYAKTGDESLDALIRPLNVFHVSNWHKHMEAIEEIAESRPGVHVVLEDDALVDENRLAQWIADSTESPRGLVFLGYPNVPASDERYVTLEGPGFSCESYMLDTESAKAMVEEFSKIKQTFGTPVQLWRIAKNSGVDVYRYAPQVFIDASKFGNFESTITPDNLLVFHSDYVDILKTLQASGDALDPADAAKMADKIDAHPFAGHVDFMILRGMVWHAARNYEKARESYDLAFRRARGLNVPLNNTQFLHRYIRLFQFIDAEIGA